MLPLGHEGGTGEGVNLTMDSSDLVDGFGSLERAEVVAKLSNQAEEKCLSNFLIL